LIETILNQEEHHTDSSEQSRSMGGRRSITDGEFGIGGHPGRYDRDKRDEEVMEMNRWILEMMERFTSPPSYPPFLYPPAPPPAHILNRNAFNPLPPQNKPDLSSTPTQSLGLPSDKKVKLKQQNKCTESIT